MTKTIKWLGALLCLLTLMIGSSASVSADERPATGNLHIHKYLGYPTKEHDGSELSDFDKPDLPPLRGIRFDIYPIADPEVSLGEGKLSREGSVLTIKTQESEKQVQLGTVKIGTTNDQGELVFADLAAGTYYIEEVLAKSRPQYLVNGQWTDIAIYEGTDPFLTGVPLPDPQNPGGWLKDIHIYPKNNSVDPGKEVAKPSVNYGEPVTWRLYGDIPAELEEYTAYRVVDELDPRLEYVAGSAKVILMENQETMIAGKDYQESLKDHRLVIEFTDAGRRKMAQVGGQWELFLDTLVHPEFLTSGNNVILNSGEIQFNNSFYPDPTEPGRHPLTGEDPTSPNYPAVNVGEIVIDKVDRDRQELKGSGFQITDRVSGDYLKLIVDPQAQKVIRVGKEVTQAEAAKGWEAWEWVIQPHGQELHFSSEKVVYTAFFDGLQTHRLSEDGKRKEALTYYVYETTTPSGYEPLGTYVKVDFGKKINTDLKDPKSFIIQKQVVNQKKERLKLPQTGMMFSMFISGIGIVFLAIGLFIYTGRKLRG